MTARPDGTAEFSRRLRLDRLASGAVEETLSATEEECAALAARFRIPAVNRLEGRLRVRRPSSRGPIVRIEGELSAEVVQTCVVTLEPVTQRVAESFVHLFTEAAGPPQREVVVPVGEEEDTPEPLEGGVIDLGEVLAEQLALALDPYPRAPDAVFAGASFGADEAHEEEDERAEESPFAALDRLKTKR